MSQTRFYGPADAIPDALAGERVAVIGYGNLGRTAALNLRDSGVAVVVGNVDDEFANQAAEEGFEVVSIAQASTADVLFVLLPDEVIPEVFTAEIGPALTSGAAIAFGSGYTLAYDLISPPDDVDVLLVAPRMAGETARARFEEGLGFWAYIGVERDASGKAHERMLGLAGGLGALRAGALDMSAEMEASIDLYIEQTVGALVGSAIMVAFEVGTSSGIPPEALVLEMYMSGEFETVFQGFREVGFFKASDAHGPTALFGGMIRTLAMDHAGLASQFATILDDIRAGGFAKTFQQERAAGYPMLTNARAMIEQGSGISVAESAVRENSSTT